LHTQDLFLACACVSGDAVALAHFDRRVLPVVATALARMGDEKALVEEVKQILRLRLFVSENGPAKVARLQTAPGSSISSQRGRGA
jgi:RNA polymerase sigma-70 factor (ECF subfamily)